MYKEYNFVIEQPDIFRDIFIAELSATGFEGFVETTEGFLAYTDVEVSPDKVLSKYSVQYTYTTSKVPEENWNASWEKQIKPLVIDEQIYIKTSFHSEKDYPLTVRIDPKMSFGTGHHETTWLMIKHLLDIQLRRKSLLDMGAGTGILAIIAVHYGALPVYAVDNDKWAYNNMLENFEKNNTTDIKSFLGDACILSDLPCFDIILANINRNILLNDIKKYIEKINKDGYLILSGFYKEDAEMIKKEAYKNGMVFEKEMSKNNWTSIRLKKI